MKNCFYVYIYLDPRKKGQYCYENVCFLHEPIYIGKGQRKRYLNHLKNLDKHINGHFKNKLMRILENEFTNFDIENHILIFRSKLSEQDAFDLEKQLINNIGRSDLKRGPLTNLAEGGKGGSSGKKLSEEHKRKLLASNLGKKLSEETKEKIRQANFRRKPPSKETRQKVSKALTGIKRGPCSEEHRKKLSIVNLNKKLSEETKRKIGLAGLGRKHSEETKQKMCKPKSKETKQRISEARKGIVFSEEHKKNLSIVKMNQKHSEETKEKISQGNRGKKYSNETKEKMRQARLLYLKQRVL